MHSINMSQHSGRKARFILAIADWVRLVELHKFLVRTRKGNAGIPTCSSTRDHANIER